MLLKILITSFNLNLDLKSVSQLFLPLKPRFPILKNSVV